MKKFIKTSELCIKCEFFLTQDKSLNLAEIPPNFELIQLSDRGGLKWPSKTVLVREQSKLIQKIEFLKSLSSTALEFSGHYEFFLLTNKPICVFA